MERHDARGGIVRGRDVPLRRRRSLGARALAALSLVVALAAVDATAAHAHTPHDDNTETVLSPQYSLDRTLFTISRQHLLRSTDGGSTWTEIVRGIGIAPLRRLAIAASDKSRMYLTSQAGVYSSIDGGQSWVLYGGGSPGYSSDGAEAIAASPTTPSLVLAGGGTSGLFRSTNGGLSWLPVGSFGHVTAISFLPLGGRVVVGTESGQIFLSVNAGATWTLQSAVAGGQPITAVGLPPPGTTGPTFAGTGDGKVLRSIDGGVTFSVYGTGLPLERVRSIALSPAYSADLTLWLSTWSSGVYRSVDGGAHWAKMSIGLTTDSQADAYGEPQFSSVAAAAAPGGGQAIFVGGFAGLFRSTDRAATWQELQTVTEFITGLAVSPSYAQDHTVAVATYVKGAYLSTSSGSAWRWADNGIGIPLGFDQWFAPVWRLENVVFSPSYSTDSTLFSATHRGLLRSTDRGESWTISAVPTDSGETVNRFFVLALSPQYRDDQTVFLATNRGRIYRSQSAGGAGTWTLAGNLQYAVRSLVMSPTFSSDHELYAGTWVGGVFKSTDQGVTWTRTGPSGVAQLAISPQYPTDGTVVAGTFAGLWITRDRGVTWVKLSSAPLTASSAINAVAISPNYSIDRTILLSVQGSGLYRSTDGGASFAAVGAGLIQANKMPVDFENATSAPIQFSSTYATDHTIWAYGGQDVMRSTDDGLTWTVLALPAATELLKPPVIANAATRAWVLEGGSGAQALLRVPFDLSHPYASTVRVDWKTVDLPGTQFATAASGDYQAASGTLVFPPGSTRQLAEIMVNGDEVVEPDELVALSLSNPVNATVGGFLGLGFGSLLNDD